MQSEFSFHLCSRIERGSFGDALAEVDWLAGRVRRVLEDLSLEKNTLVLFVSDNGPWLVWLLPIFRVEDSPNATNWNDLHSLGERTFGWFNGTFHGSLRRLCKHR